MKREPVINWKAMMELNRPPMPPVRPDMKGHNMWDDNADFYNKMSEMEKELTLNQIRAFPLEPDMTVIDLGCGCGRLTVPVAERVKAVTALDSSGNMMNNCLENVRKAGLNNVTELLLDYFDAKAGENVPVHDFAFCSRSAALHDIEKLSTFGSKYAAIVIWANGPSIPELIGRLFDGTTAKPRPMRGPMGQDRRIGYNVFWNMIYDAGYEPNASVVQDGFRKFYKTKDEAYEDLAVLGEIDSGFEDRFHKNVDEYLTEKEDGFEFFMETRSVVIWWETHPKQFSPAVPDFRKLL